MADSLQSMFSPIGEFTKLAIKAFVFLSLDTLCKASMKQRGEGGGQIFIFLAGIEKSQILLTVIIR